MQCEDKAQFGGAGSPQISLFPITFAVSKVKSSSNFKALKTEEEFYFKQAAKAFDPSPLLFEHALLYIN